MATKYDDLSSGHVVVLPNNKPLQEEGIKFESSVFNSMFQVNATDPVEAFKILTPQRIEAIVTLNQMFKGEVALLFFENRLNISIIDDYAFLEKGKIKMNDMKSPYKRDLLKDAQYYAKLLTVFEKLIPKA